MQEEKKEIADGKEYDPFDPNEGCLGHEILETCHISVWKITGYMYNLCVSSRWHAGIYDNVYNYSTAKGALEAMKSWDGTEEHEPEGWFRHPATGRRRPDGDKSKEYIRA
jgi:hypothetical protein